MNRSRRAVLTLVGSLVFAGVLVHPASAETTLTPSAEPTATATATATASATATAKPTATTTTTTVTPTKKTKPLTIGARADAACHAVTFSITGLIDGQFYEVHRNVDSKGWEPVKAAASRSETIPGAGVVAYRVVQGERVNETGAIALNQCNGSKPTTTPTKPTTAPKGQVTAKYECGAVHFHNGTDKVATIHYGIAQSDTLEGTITVQPGKTVTVESTSKEFGWTARDSKGNDIGHEWEPQDVSCDEPDDSKPTTKPTTKPTKKPTKKPTATATATATSRGLASTGV